MKAHDVWPCGAFLAEGHQNRRNFSAMLRQISLVPARASWCSETTMIRAMPDAAATWSKLLGKKITYAGHGDFNGFKAQLRKTGSPSWLAYDLRVMYQGYVERGFSNTEDQTARFAALLGHLGPIKGEVWGLGVDRCSPWQQFFPVQPRKIKPGMSGVSFDQRLTLLPSLIFT